jgi:hypothetical protein
MKKITIYLLPLFAIALFSTSAFSQKVGSTSMQFLKVMPVARATALGDAYTVLASGADAVFWNPAGVALTENNDISLTYIKWFIDTKQGALSYATTIPSFGSIGFQMQYVDFGEIEETMWADPYKQDRDFPGLTGRTFRPFTYLVGLTYANQLTDKFSTGVTVKYAHESLYDGETHQAFTSQGDTVTINTWANGLMFDFGLQYNTGFRSIRIAASVQNFGANVKYANEGNAIPLALRVGIAADLIGATGFYRSGEDSRLTAAFDLFQPNDYEQQAHAGMEYEYAHTFSLRAGYKLNYDTEGLTAGVGFQHTSGPVTFAVDYSFGKMNTLLGDVHRISLGAKF